MIVKKTGGSIIGAHLTNAEKKALEIEVRKMVASELEKAWTEVDAIILWQLHANKRTRFGKGRLRSFYDDFVPEVDALIDRYQMNDSDDVWLCTRKLKGIGVDLEEWRKQNEEIRRFTS